jgi:hypothetical protein
MGGRCIVERLCVDRSSDEERIVQSHHIANLRKGPLLFFRPFVKAKINAFPTSLPLSTRLTHDLGNQMRGIQRAPCRSWLISLLICPYV